MRTTGIAQLDSWASHWYLICTCPQHAVTDRSGKALPTAPPDANSATGNTSIGFGGIAQRAAPQLLAHGVGSARRVAGTCRAVGAVCAECQGAWLDLARIASARRPDGVRSVFGRDKGNHREARGAVYVCRVIGVPIALRKRSRRRANATGPLPPLQLLRSRSLRVSRLVN